MGAMGTAQPPTSNRETTCQKVRNMHHPLISPPSSGSAVGIVALFMTLGALVTTILEWLFAT